MAVICEDEERAGVSRTPASARSSQRRPLPGKHQSRRTGSAQSNTECRIRAKLMPLVMLAKVTSLFIVEEWLGFH